MSHSEKAFKKVTDQLLSLLDEGVIPWRKPWNSNNEVPTNLSSGRKYTGITNIMLLNCLPFERPYFVTFKQAKELGGSVKKGESSAPIIWWQIKHYFEGDRITQNEAEQLKNEGRGDEVKSFPVLRYFNVFNVAQCEGLDHLLPELKEGEKIDFEPISECEKIWENWADSPDVTHRGSRAFYTPFTDSITMPERSNFISEEEYYSTLFHEGVHATGHESRCNRELNTNKSSDDYSFEELIAEIGSAMLCGKAGVEKAVIENSAAYIQGWKSKLKNEGSDWFIKATTKAKKSVKYILDEKQNNEGVKAA